MNDKWCVRCGRTTPTPYTLKVLEWRRKATLPLRSVLDLGCGNGRNLRAFQINGRARRMVGFDLCVKRARSICRAHICRPVRLCRGTLGHDPLPKGRFDIVLLNYSLMFLDLLERERVIADAYDRLTRGGWLVVEMYPARDSECTSDEACEHVIDQEVFRRGANNFAHMVRRSKNRIIMEKVS